MLALLANWTSRLLQSLAPTSPDAGAVILVTIGLSGWALWELYQSSRRSPLVFSPEDALLLCQTPASRQLIALAWFAARWLEVALPGGLVVLVLESGVVGLAIRGELEMSDLLRYALAGLRGLSLVIPWQTAMLALAWAVGAHRLQGDRDRRAWRWAAPLAALLLGMGLLWSGGDSNMAVPCPAVGGLWPGSLAAGHACRRRAGCVWCVCSCARSESAQSQPRRAGDKQAGRTAAGSPRWGDWLCVRAGPAGPAWTGTCPDPLADGARRGGCDGGCCDVERRGAIDPRLHLGSAWAVAVPAEC